MGHILFKEESYKIIGCCLEVYNELGCGFREIIYKDALDIEFRRRGIPFIREKAFKISYKGLILPRTYDADFLMYDKIILEVKSARSMIAEFLYQTKNYLKAGECRLGIIANFGETSFHSHRVLL